MSAAPAVPTRRWTGVARWSGCLAVVVAGHALAVALILRRPSESIAIASQGLPIVLALAPAAAASDKASDAPPAPIAGEAEAAVVPEESSASEQPPQRDAAPPDASPPVPSSPVGATDRLPARLTSLPPPRPRSVAKERAVRNPPHERRASVAAAPPHAERKAERSAAPVRVASAHDADAVPNWKARLVAQIERYKRYPAPAEARGEQGTAEVAFSVDRNGGVHHARVVKSTGSPLLDADALAWLRRAAPLPPPPPEVTGALIPIVVPLRYRLN